MIEEYYSAKKETTILQLPHQSTKYWPNYGKDYQQNQPPQQQQHRTTTETERAQKRGLTVEEYRRRVTIVAKAQSECRFQIGDTVWPYSVKDAKKLGKCIISGFCRHYDDYGETDWNESPLLLSIQSLSDRSLSYQCSVDWVVKQAPEGIEEITNEC